jgi:hypothetical protein
MFSKISANIAVALAAFAAAHPVASQDQCNTGTLLLFSVPLFFGRNLIFSFRPDTMLPASPECGLSVSHRHLRRPYWSWAYKIGRSHWCQLLSDYCHWRGFRCHMVRSYSYVLIKILTDPDCVIAPGKLFAARTINSVSHLHSWPLFSIPIADISLYRWRRQCWLHSSQCRFVDGFSINNADQCMFQKRRREGDLGLVKAHTRLPSY